MPTGGCKKPEPIKSSDARQLYPDEAIWVDERMKKTKINIDAFIKSTLGVGAPLPAGRQDIRIAVTNSGGGKRAMFNSFGE